MANADQTEENSNSTMWSQMLPVDPYRSLWIHYGMMLGVKDFRTLDAYHRGKMWMHSAWLHREGTVWGLGVSIDGALGEIKVSSGAAVDALGRELYLSKDACLNLGRWYEEHKNDPDLSGIISENNVITFNAHVVIKSKACLAEQVPALTEPCEGAGATTAYSRVIETVELLLVPGLDPGWQEPPGSLPYHRLRLLFGLEAPIEEDGKVIGDDQEVLKALDEILKKPLAEQPGAYLKWFRHFSALDQIELTSASDEEEGETDSFFPSKEPAPITLANIANITLSQDEESGWTVVGGDVDNTIRPVHVPTTTIQELLCGPIYKNIVQGDGETGEIGEGGRENTIIASDRGIENQPGDIRGPRIDPETVFIDNERTISFNVTDPLMEACINEHSISVTLLDDNKGWEKAKNIIVGYDSSSKRITVKLRKNPGNQLVRLVVKGTGESPVLGSNCIPLAGAVGGSAGSEIDGNDFVFMLRRS